MGYTVNNYNVSTRETEAGKSGIKGCLDYMSLKKTRHSNKKPVQYLNFQVTTTFSLLETSIYTSTRQGIKDPSSKHLAKNYR